MAGNRNGRNGSRAGAKKETPAQRRKRLSDERTAANKARFLERFRETGLYRGTCRELDIGTSTVGDWRQSDEEFAVAYASAQDAAVDAMEEEAYRRAVKGVERPVFQGGQEVGRITEYSDALLTTLLKAHKPDKYRENVKVSGGLDLRDERRRAAARSDEELAERLSGRGLE